MKLIDWKSSEGPFQKKIDILNMGKELYFFLEETQNIFYIRINCKLKLLIDLILYFLESVIIVSDVANHINESMKEGVSSFFLTF